MADDERELMDRGRRLADGYVKFTRNFYRGDEGRVRLVLRHFVMRITEIMKGGK